ncbi:hypothetical protein ACE01N_19925, partial [Saccharicrinis sp. FJH2]|uniref:hypothetical protein n=1 Tax=Saccharicrinis sp. FJH65 TaxID=3344659 RepID=UPI0035F4A482
MNVYALYCAFRFFSPLSTTLNHLSAGPGFLLAEKSVAKLILLSFASKSLMIYFLPKLKTNSPGPLPLPKAAAKKIIIIPF